MCKRECANCICKAQRAEKANAVFQWTHLTIQIVCASALLFLTGAMLLDVHRMHSRRQEAFNCRHFGQCIHRR